MTKEQVLQDISKLIQDIDKCENELVKAKLTDDIIRLTDAYCETSRLMVSAHQELTFLYDHIKSLYGLMKKADEVYFRAGNLSANMNSAKALREAREDYWHYVNYEMNKKGDKDD